MSATIGLLMICSLVIPKLIVGQNMTLHINHLAPALRNNLKKICGVSYLARKRSVSNLPQFKVVGTDAVPKQFPWNVRIYFRNPLGLGNSKLCSGVLITQQHVLTAAHCFFLDNPSTLFPYQPYVIVGTLDINKVVDHDGFVKRSANSYRITGIKFHPRYKVNRPLNNSPYKNPSHIHYDVVIAQLHKPVKPNLLNERIALPVCLPTDKETGIGKDIRFAGYGKYLGVLRWTTVVKSSCSFIASLTNTYYKSTCYKPAYNQYSTGPGDSGGGLVEKGSTNRWHVIGVYHGKVGLKSPLHTAVYVPVKEILPWIKQQVGNF